MLIKQSREQIILAFIFVVFVSSIGVNIDGPYMCVLGDVRASFLKSDIMQGKKNHDKRKWKSQKYNAGITSVHVERESTF